MATKRMMGFLFLGAGLALCFHPFARAFQAAPDQSGRKSVAPPRIADAPLDISSPSSILAVAIPRTLKNRRAAMAFTYGIQYRNRNFTQTGKLLIDYSAKYEVIFVGGLPYRRLLEENQRPLDGPAAAEEQRRYDQTFAERNQMSLEEKRAYLKRPWNVDFPLPQLTRLFSNTLAGEEIVNGRPAIVIESIPRTDVSPADEEDRRALHKQLRLWIDREDLIVSRLEARLVADDASMKKGTVARIDFLKKEGVWLPAQSDVSFEAKRGFDTVRGETKEENRDFHRFRVDVRLMEPQETAVDGASGAQ
ncbi:hypothetical protein ACPOL_0045 [Acidisarcina polymorpha]|uniref:Uncharacterized protein n=1 Tax=Acidisarcina polymorpha TaxID=2211140 RepID=A0A2Z5FRV9_9BACT|nr:hypothetical protein [Acidisarcina polymorpha]AXC09432.1 hypothetical protein ACPOL_0045 [Acidisarcina polymorpha]